MITIIVLIGLVGLVIVNRWGGKKGHPITATGISKWSFVDGNTDKGINKDKTKSTDFPQLTVFNTKLYAVWSENNGNAWQIRAAVGQ